MNQTALARIVAAMPAELPKDRRFVVALAGPPAAGKSTIADQIRRELEPHAAVLGLDAFHYDNSILSERDELFRKGAPQTFDVAGYRRMLAVLRHNPGETIAIPKFERDLDLTRSAAEIVSPQHAILITEGNYLLLAEEPWSSLSENFDLTVSVTTTIDVIEARILQRWRSHGLTDSQAAKRYASNDLLNARLTLDRSQPGALSIHT